MCNEELAQLIEMEENDYENNPLRIVEEEIPPKSPTCDNSDDNESNGELFDFSSSDIEEVERVGDATAKRNSLLIIEDKDLMMEAADDFNNNNSSLHRLSLQIESGDENSLVMTNEAINRTIIRIGSNGSSVDFGEADGGLSEKPHEAINHKFNDSTRRMSHNESFQDDGEVIVNILGQINDIVGCPKLHICFTVACPNHLWGIYQNGDGLLSVVTFSVLLSSFLFQHFNRYHGLRLTLMTNDFLFRAISTG